MKKKERKKVLQKYLEIKKKEKEKKITEEIVHQDSYRSRVERTHKSAYIDKKMSIFRDAS